MITEHDICAFVVDKIIDDILFWINDEKVDVDEIKRELIRAFEFESDGFRIARTLDDHGWDANSELVELLDDAFMHRAEAVMTLSEAQGTFSRPD